MKKLFAVLMAMMMLLSGMALAEDAPGTFSLSVRENATTGYTWSCKLTGDDCLKVTGDELTLDNTDPTMVGVGGTRAFTFEAVRPGTAVITLNWGRSWEEGYEKTLTCTVTVGEDLRVALAETTAPVATITLHENTTTGYAWRVQIADEKKLFLLADVSKYLGDNDMCGAGSERTFTFQAMGKEGCTVTFTYARSWEENSAIATVTAEFTVGENGELLLTNLAISAPDGFADGYVVSK